MDRKNVRLENLKNLFDKYVQEGNGAQRKLKDYAELLGINAVHLSQMRNGSRGIGSCICKRIEEKLGLPPGWMDRDHSGPNPVGPTEEAIVEAIMKLYRSDREGNAKALVKFCAEHGLQLKLPKGTRVR